MPHEVPRASCNVVSSFEVPEACLSHRATNSGIDLCATLCWHVLPCGLLFRSQQRESVLPRYKIRRLTDEIAP